MGSIARRATTRFDIEDAERIKKNTFDSFRVTGNGGDDGGCGVGGAFDVESRIASRSMATVLLLGVWCRWTRRANGGGCVTDGLKLCAFSFFIRDD